MSVAALFGSEYMGETKDNEGLTPFGPKREPKTEGFPSPKDDPPKGEMTEDVSAVEDVDHKRRARMASSLSNSAAGISFSGLTTTGKG
mmetsp:Transcript_17063/g.49273  ORF Transcript_17063/g.49273 Transcript_17063/m.49273 type:complete len:88 (+) Transcript_17063:514-777(+)